MDTKRFGTFIAERRKELGLTQAALAEQLHVTDKAVSRWERGVGLPDISNIENLAEALDVSLIELMQAERNEEKMISKQEAEELLLDTIQLPKTTDYFMKVIAGSILALFVVMSVLLFILSLYYKLPSFRTGSIITGLIAWGLPIWYISFAKKKRTDMIVTGSFGFAFISIIMEFGSNAHLVKIRDWTALEDTIDAVIIVVVLFSVITLLLNIIAVGYKRFISDRFPNRRKEKMIKV